MDYIIQHIREIRLMLIGVGLVSVIAVMRFHFRQIQARQHRCQHKSTQQERSRENDCVLSFSADQLREKLLPQVERQSKSLAQQELLLMLCEVLSGYDALHKSNAFQEQRDAVLKAAKEYGIIDDLDVDLH